jgi:hypothetical protein
MTIFLTDSGSVAQMQLLSIVFLQVFWFAAITKRSLPPSPLRTDHRAFSKLFLYFTNVQLTDRRLNAFVKLIFLLSVCTLKRCQDKSLELGLQRLPVSGVECHRFAFSIHLFLLSFL